MKQTITIFLLFYCIATTAQSYNCLVPGSRTFFINGNNYVRGMRIDSVRTVGTDVIYYPYHTSRAHDYLSNGMPVIPPNPITDSSGASWLGKKVICQPDGTFLFDNMWDTVIIKSQAHTGDSWIFFNDTTRYSYTATVTAEGVMPVLGVMDSVKTITITADSSGIAHPIDPVNNFQIMLSKNNGLVQAIDLYTFPYHRPDTVRHTMDIVDLHLRFFDYYLDVVLNNLGTCDLGVCFDNVPDTNNSVFRLFNLYNPRETEIYDFAAGDVYESYFVVSGPSTSYQKYTLDSVFDRTTTAYGVHDTGREHSETINIIFAGSIMTPDTTYAARVYNISADTSRLLDTFAMPEEWRTGYFLHYSHGLPGLLTCDSPASYEIGGDLGVAGLANSGFNLAPSYRSNTYSIGYGMSGMKEYNAISFLNYGQWYNYYLKNGMECGIFFPTYHDLTGVSASPKAADIDVYPNPAAGYVTIAPANGFTGNAFIVVYDMSGSSMYHTSAPLQKGLTINTASWPAGTYIITTENEQGIIKTEKLIIGNR